METNTVYWLLYKGIYHYLGIEVSKAYRKSKKEYHRSLGNTQRICNLCGEPIKWKDMSVDHIISRSIIWETGLVGLIFDHRNFQVAHKLCNVKRGGLTLDDLPDKVRNKLFVR